MRVRTDEKRREIVEAAASLFVEQGYERTSMSAISERVGGSKATLYGYFPSKEDLLRAVLAYDVSQESMAILQEFPEDEDICEGLTRLGIRYLTERLAPLPITNMRTLASLPVDSNIGRDFYATSLKPAWELLAQRLLSLMNSGRLKYADPWVAAMHWKGLNEGELLERRLLGASSIPDAKEIARVARLAADAFIRIYGLDQDELGGAS